MINRINAVLFSMLLLICALHGHAYETEYVNAKLAYDFAYWSPNELVGAKTKTVGKNILELSLDVSPSLPYISEIKYWWTPGNRPQQQELLEAEENEAGFERWLAGLQLPIGDTSSRYYSYLYVDFEKTAFSGTSTAEQDIEYVPFGGARYVLATGEDISYLTTFDTQSIGWRAHSFLGAFTLAYEAITYRRPFNITQFGQVLDETVYDAKFSGEAIRFMFDTDGRTENHLPYGFKIGASFPTKGDIKFASNQSLDDYFGEAQTVGYFRKFLSLRARHWFNSHFHVYASYDLEQIEFTTGTKTEGGASYSSDGSIDIAKENLHMLGFGLLARY